MAISTYSELKTAIDRYLETGASVEDSDIANFIALAEERINRTLRTRRQETVATVTITDGEGSLPADFLELRANTGTDNWRTSLRFLTPDAATDVYGNGYGADPINFTITGSTLTIYPTPTGNVEIVYYAKIPALSDAAPTNWLLTNYPSVYLFGSLVQAAMFGAADVEMATPWAAAFEQGLREIRTDDLMARYPRPAARISGPTP